MKTAIAVLASIVAIVVISCQPIQPTPAGVVAAPPAPGAPPAMAFPIVGSAPHAAACPFNASQIVVSLAPGFDANTYGNCSPGGSHCASGPPQPGGPAPQILVKTVADAFAIAPAAVQTEMCRLDHIYIDSNSGSPNTRPWGMRERLRSNIRHVGIPASVFAPNPQGTSLGDPSYSLYEQRILTALLPAAAGTPTVTAVPDRPEIKMLAIIAHEIGHILWWHGDGHFDVTHATCPGRGKFLPKSWYFFNNAPPHGFHNFRSTQYGNLPLEQFTYADLFYVNSTQLLNDLDDIYSDGHWASLFAFVAPDEDFAETYKMVALDPSVTSLTTTIPSLQPFEVFQDLRDPTSILGLKADWVRNCL